MQMPAAPHPLIALCGFAGAGKDTAADRLVAAHGYERMSFSAALKDVLAAMFGWDREALDGRTPEHRAWREGEDGWWAAALGLPGFSPRRALQVVGTEVMRAHMHPRVWVLAVERRLCAALADGRRVVLTDCRFPEEVELVKALGGRVWVVQRGDSPPPQAQAHALASAGVHRSEWAWLEALPPDALRLHNEGASVAQLHARVDAALRSA